MASLRWAVLAAVVVLVAAPLHAETPAFVAPPRPGESPADAWRRFFAHETPAAPQVRSAVRQLAADGKHGQIVALVEGALNHGQGQPWMFEALALAHLAAGDEPAEIERALLSAVDLDAADPDNTLYAAAYLARVGRAERALRLLDHVRRTWPARRETCRLALPLAEALEDPAAIAWAALGILAEPPSRETQARWDDAESAARRLVGQLRVARRHREAAELAAGLQDALARDCVVAVSWTGAADVDLSVEEPDGSVCSSTQRQSAAGGVFERDAMPAPGDASKPGGAKSAPLVEQYVCARALAGDYRLRLRRVWGKPTAGAVTVEVATHVGTEAARHYRQVIPLGDSDAVVTFSLARGRRVAGVDQIAEQVVGRGEKIRKQLVLAEIDYLAQIGAVQPAGAAPGFVGAVTQRPFVMGVTPIVGPNGAIGYMPNIVVLNEGTQLTTLAVVSPDRKRVRITSSMMVSHVSGVTTFNMGTGATTFLPLPGP